MIANFRLIRLSLMTALIAATFQRAGICATSVTDPVSVTVPKVASILSSNGNVSENLAITPTVSSSTLASTGSASQAWDMRTNSTSGATVTIQRGSVTLTGGAVAALANSLSVSCSNGAGTVTCTPSAKYSAGASLTTVSTIGETFCSTGLPGDGQFNLIVALNAAASAGSGTVATTFTMIVAAL